ncbi:MAG: hypothetical protein ACOC2V_07645, partial [Alkalispirochaeta sp.]
MANPPSQINERSPYLAFGTLFLFWLPLALMWIFMGIEQPILNGAMARFPEATLSLAAFEVAFAIALVIESPIIQMLSAATALVRGPRSYRGLLRFMHVLALILTALHIVISRPVVFGFVAGTILRVPEHVIDPARRAFTVLIPFAALVGYRRLWQGSLIQLGRTGIVAQTMIARLAVTIGALLAGGLVIRGGVALPRGGGAFVAATALSLGVATGAGAAWWYYRREARREAAGAGGEARAAGATSAAGAT